MTTISRNLIAPSHREDLYPLRLGMLFRNLSDFHLTLKFSYLFDEKAFWTNYVLPLVDRATNLF